MDYKKINKEIWKELDIKGNQLSGYKSKYLAINDIEDSNLHIFKDEFGFSHFAIKADKAEKEILDSTNVNGLQISILYYRFYNEEANQFIDLKCNLNNYLEEFTEIVREITKGILIKKQQPIHVVNQVIRNWISFWTEPRMQILSKEAQIGLFCELIVLKMLCNINVNQALKKWIGPTGGINDFSFTHWNLEVKGTRNHNQNHKINGIEQLSPPLNKRLGFISFQVNESSSENSINISTIIESIKNDFFENKPDLIIQFNSLLAQVGYTPAHLNEYLKFNLEIIKATFFEVNDEFPKLIPTMLKNPLNNRISSVKYEISLEGISGTDLNSINWGDYFF
jgi:hypothetical protein